MTDQERLLLAASYGWALSEVDTLPWWAARVALDALSGDR